MLAEGPVHGADGLREASAGNIALLVLSKGQHVFSLDNDSSISKLAKPVSQSFARKVNLLHFSYKMLTPALSAVQ